MIDPGHPFSVPYQDLIEGLEERIREGVEQPDRARFTFQSSVTTYELPRTAYAITRISGLVGTSFTLFQPGVHYRFSNNRIIWRTEADVRPNEGSKFEVEYTYRERPAGLTDFNPGSVIGTLIRTVAREMKLLYEQMDQAYRRAFIDHAPGVALDNVVALLGLERNPAIPAEGEVTFFRKNAADRTYPIPVGTRVADESERSFLTTQPGAISAESIDEFGWHVSGVLTVQNRIAELVGVWPSAADPETDPPLTTLDTEPDPPFGASERAITLDLTAGEDTEGELRVRYVPKSVTVPIVAAEAGPEGNVNAETIVIMPTPPTGIDGVINEAPVTGGKVAETDDQLRDRAKHHLERLGNATLNAIKYAVLEIDGVEGVEVADHSVDSTIPLGEVRVSYSGGDLEDVRGMVDGTRAAGILAVFSEIAEVLVSGTFYVIPDVAVLESAVADFKAAVVEAIEALDIGQPLSPRRLNALVYDVGGLADVAEARLEARGAPIPDPFLVTRTELIRPDEANLRVFLLTGLHVVETRRVGATNEIDLQLLTELGAVEFEDFALDLTIAVRARLNTAPDQPPAVIGSLKGQIAFDDSATAQLIISDDQVRSNTGFDDDEHDPHLEITIASTAYPGLSSVDTAIDLSLS